MDWLSHIRRGNTPGASEPDRLFPTCPNKKQDASHEPKPTQPYFINHPKPPPNILKSPLLGRPSALGGLVVRLGLGPAGSRQRTGPPPFLRERGQPEESWSRSHSLQAAGAHKPLTTKRLRRILLEQAAAEGGATHRNPAL